MAMWPDDNEPGAPIDAAIADAARQMTDGAPGGDFRARVLARLGEREPVSGRWRLAWMLAPIAVALIISFIIVGRFVDSGDRGSNHAAIPPRPIEATTRQPEPPTAASAQPKRRQTPTSVRLNPGTTSARDGSRGMPGGSRALRVAPSDVDALAPAPLDVESIRLAALPPADSIGVAPLEGIEPIDVEPLATSEIDPAAQRRER